MQADDIGELFGKGQVVGELEVAPAVWAEAMRLPGRLHGRSRNAGIGGPYSMPIVTFSGNTPYEALRDRLWSGYFLQKQLKRLRASSMPQSPPLSR